MNYRKVTKPAAAMTLSLVLAAGQQQPIQIKKKIFM